MLKQIVDKLKIVGNQLFKMEQEKQMAIDNEDYDVAKQLKQQMEFIKSQAFQMAGFEQTQEPIYESVQPEHNMSQQFN